MKALALDVDGICGRWASRFARSNDEYHEFAQVARVKLFEERAKIEAAMHPATFAYMVAKNAIREEIRRAARRASVPVDDFAFLQAPDLMSKVDAAAFATAILDGIHRDHRAVLMAMIKYERREQASRAMGCSVNEYKKRLCRARVAARKYAEGL